MGYGQVRHSGPGWPNCTDVSCSFAQPFLYHRAYSIAFAFFPQFRYEAQLEKDWQHILVDSDAKVLVVATEAIYEKVKDYPGKVNLQTR